MTASHRVRAALIALLVTFPAHAEETTWSLARLSYSSGWDSLPAIVGMERGFFAERGIVVSGLAVPSTKAVVSSLAAGSTDFAAVPQRTLLLMAAAKVPAKAVSMNGWGRPMELVVPKGEQSIQSVADLEGKTLAVGTASEAFPVIVRLLNQAKLDPEDLTFKRLTANQLTQAFSEEKNLADAVFESRHFTSVLVNKGLARVVLGPQEVVRKLGLIGAAPLVARTPLIENDPELVQNFVTAWIEGLTYIQRNPKDSARLLVIFFHRQGVTVSESLAESWVRLTRYDRYFWSPHDIADAEYNGWGLKEGGVFKVRPKLEGYIDNWFAREALKELGVEPGRPPKAPAAGSP